MKRKKELHIIYIITKLELGGAQKICLSLFQELKKECITTSLISGDQGFLTSKVKNQSSVILLPTLKREISLFFFIHEIKAFLHLIKCIRTIKRNAPYTIVHTHSTKAGLLGRWAAFFAGIKYRVHTIHGYAFHQHQNNIVRTCIYLLELITSFITTHFICVSSEDTKKGIKLFPKFSTKHSIIRAAVNEKLFNVRHHVPPLFPIKTPFIIGTVACFKPQKNLIDLLKAFTVVYHQNNNTRLEIIGDGIQRPVIEQWIKEHELGSVVTLHGWQENIIPFMKSWHIFALSSLWEGLPCAIIEARLLKLPVLSYNTGGIRDVIIHGQNGFLYPQKDWQALSKGMLTVSMHKELFTQLQNYSDELGNFHHKAMINQHCTLYHSLLSKLEMPQQEEQFDSVL